MKPTDDRGPARWMLLIAAALWLAAISAMFGLVWNQDVLYLIHLGVSVWALFAVTVERARIWTWLSSISLFGITALGLASAYQGYCYGLYNSFWHWDQTGWFTSALVAVNYIIVSAVAIRSQLLLRAGKRRLLRIGLTVGGLTVQFVLIAAAGVWILSASPEYVHIVDRKAVSLTHVYEKWNIDYGGTGGDDCRVYEIHTIGLIARYEQIDADRSPSPFGGGGCGN